MAAHCSSAPLCSACLPFRQQSDRHRRLSDHAPFVPAQCRDASDHTTFVAFHPMITEQRRCLGGWLVFICTRWRFYIGLLIISDGLLFKGSGVVWRGFVVGFLIANDERTVCR